MSAPLICAATWVLTIGRIESYRPVHKGSGMSDSESDEPPVRMSASAWKAYCTLADLDEAPVQRKGGEKGQEAEGRTSTSSLLGHHLRREESGESASEEEAWATAAVSEGAPRFRSSAACPRSPRSARGTRERKVKDSSKDPLIYLLLNLENGHGYVGKAVDSHRRMYEHETGKRGPNGKLQLVDQKIQQYGWHNFAVIWLETNVPTETLLDREAYWMTFLCTQVGMNGYNILKPGVEGISMDDPEIRKRWEAGNPEGVRKAVEAKRKKREEKLAAMDPEVADELRKRLEDNAHRGRKRRRGECGGPSARYTDEVNQKRSACWERKRMEKVAKMSPEDAAAYLLKNEKQRRIAKRNRAARSAYNRRPDRAELHRKQQQEKNRSLVRLG